MSGGVQTAVDQVTVLNFQRAMARLHAQGNAIPDPGVLDGVWGRRTQDAWDAFARGSAIEPALVDVDGEPRMLQIVGPSAGEAANFIREEAAQHPREPARRQRPATSMTPAPGGGLTTEDFAPQRGLTTVQKALIGAGVVGVFVGVGVWVWRRQR